MHRLLKHHNVLHAIAVVRWNVDSPPDAWRGVTIRQAMSHPSGLPSLIGPQDGRRSVWDSGGRKAALMHYPNDGITVILLTNRGGSDVFTPTTEIAALYLEAK